tara:strand:- start:1452 stop:1898 length:447 start_codon:yes stop_codon:yes gene_type:complete
MAKVELSYAEVFQGAMIGVMRLLRRNKAKRSELRNTPPTGTWERSIEGAISEMALAKHLNVFLADHTNREIPDVGDVDCRATSHKNGSLIVHPYDADDRLFYLLVGMHGQYEIKGWIKGADAKQDKWWKDPVGGRPAYFVPQEELNDG